MPITPFILTAFDQMCIEIHMLQRSSVQNYIVLCLYSSYAYNRKSVSENLHYIPLCNASEFKCLSANWPRWLSWMRVRLETRRSRVRPPPRSATFFRGDWSWNIFYGHSLPSADSRRAVVSFWRKNVHNTDKPLRGLSLLSKCVVR